jgi:hypothetical protein
LQRCRRLSTDDEWLSSTSEAVMRVVMIHLMGRRLARAISFHTFSNPCFVAVTSRLICPTHAALWTDLLSQSIGGGGYGIDASPP